MDGKLNQEIIAPPPPEETFAAANLPEEWWPNCYIADSGQIFTPQFDAEGNMTMTGEEAYQQWRENKDKPAESSELTAEEQLQQRITDLELSDIAQGQMLTDLELENIENGQKATDLEIQVLELMNNVQQPKNTL